MIDLDHVILRGLLLRVPHVDVITAHKVASVARLSVTLVVTVRILYGLGVILSYRDERTSDFARGKRVKAFSGVERSARLKLDRLEAATSIMDLAALPGNRFEALKGKREGQYSIRINDQWRICFEWHGRSLGPTNVEIVDYH